MKKYKKYIIIGVFAALVSMTTLFFIFEFLNLQSGQSSNGHVKIHVTIPVKTSWLYAENQLLAGMTYYYDVRVDIENLITQSLDNLTIDLVVPDLLALNTGSFSPANLTFTGNKIHYNKTQLLASETVVISFKIKTPGSVPFTSSEILSVVVDYVLSSVPLSLSYGHLFFVNPIPSWVTYGTLLLGIAILVATILIAKKKKILEKFSTIDLANITVLASLGAIVFKWIWQMFNDFFGIFGGLLLTIPASFLMIIAILLVKKPGTATIFFVVWELVNFFIWGSNIMSWFGWYILEGVLVDACIVLFKDNAERWYTASLYGMIRCFIAYWTTYFWFSPAIWKIYYAPWYAWLQILIGCVGGIIGGALGFYIGKRLEEAIGTN